MTIRAMTRAMTRSMSVADAVAPTGYSVTFGASSYELNTDADAVSVDIAGAEVGAHYTLTISSDGGGEDVVLSGNAPSAAFSRTGIDCSGLTDGTLTASLVMTDASGNEGDPAEDTATLAPDTTAPTGYTVAFGAASYQLGVDADAVSVDIEGAEIGAAYALAIESSGGGTPVEDNGTVAAADFSIPDLDCSDLTAGTLTATLVLTDADANEGDPATDTATLAGA